jgi:hypothetical protein
MVVYAYDPSTQETEVEGLIQGQSRLYIETLVNK